MDLTNCADCGPPFITVVLLLLAAIVAAALAYRILWTIVFSVPLLVVALVRFGSGGYSHSPEPWLVMSMLLSLGIGIFAGRRRRRAT